MELQSTSVFLSVLLVNRIFEFCSFIIIIMFSALFPTVFGGLSNNVELRNTITTVYTVFCVQKVNILHI